MTPYWVAGEYWVAGDRPRPEPMVRICRVAPHSSARCGVRQIASAMGRRLIAPAEHKVDAVNRAKAFGLAAFHLDRMADHFPPGEYPRVKRSTFEHGVVLAGSDRALKQRAVSSICARALRLG